MVAVEDRRYWQHGGIDWRALIRAFLSRFVYFRRKLNYIRSGGSTIPMQLIRTLFIIHGQAAWKRKLFELLLAPWISCRFTKGDLLNMHLACVRYERGVMGLTNGIRHFFAELKGKRLSNEEAFLLVERLSNATSTVNMNRVDHLITRASVPLDKRRLAELYGRLVKQKSKPS